MSKYIDVKRVSLGQEESKCLDGAISTCLDIPFLRSSRGYPYCELMPDWRGLYGIVSSEYVCDNEYDIFTNEKGAVANAYRIDVYDQEERQKVISEILEGEQRKHPEYEYMMCKEYFPVDLRDFDDVVYSDYVLYITNYKEFLKTKTR